MGKNQNTTIQTNQHPRISFKQGIDLGVIFALIICIILISYLLIFKIGSEGSQCTLKPLEFGYTKLQEANKDALDQSCSCTILKNTGQGVISFNSTDTWLTTPQIKEINYPKINFSNLN